MTAFFGIGHHGRQQVRDAVVDRQLQHLGIDHDEPAFLRPEPVEQRQDHGVDGDRFARARGAGDEQVRHAGQIDDHRLAADRLAERDGELVARFAELVRGDELAQEHRLALLVRQFDADDVAALHHRHAGRDRRHGAGDIVREVHDAARFHAGRRLELVEGHHRAWPDRDDLAADTKILEHTFEQAGVLLQRFARHGEAMLLLRRREEVDPDNRSRPDRLR